MAQDDYTGQLQKVLRGQTAPRSTDGGTRVLWRCVVCGKPWLMDGIRSEYRLGEERATTFAAELGANLDNLPYGTCRLCSALENGGEFSMDDYGHGRGLGISAELMEPVGGHLIATIINWDYLQRQRQLVRMGRQPTGVSVVADYHKAHALLRWLTTLETPTTYHTLTQDDSDKIAAGGSHPGHGMPGTENWRWYGAEWLASCPPLGGKASIRLMMAMPQNEPFSVGRLVRLWRGLGRTLDAGTIAGETLDNTKED